MHTEARVVIIGGGIVGASIAYHLAKLGWRDIVVVEQGELVSGTTSHAPGLVGQLRSSPSLMRMLMYSVFIYRTLAADGTPGFLGEGSLRLASSKARWTQIRAQAEHAQRAGLEVQLLSPAEVVAKIPLLDMTGVEGALWVPSDGSAAAPLLAEALIRHARESGVAFYPATQVREIELRNGCVTAVQTSAGRIATESVVIAAGIWSPGLDRMDAVSLPLVPIQHQYVETAALPRLANAIVPNVRDPDKLIYFRQRERSLVIGGYERNPEPFDGDAIPDGANPTVGKFDPFRFQPLWSAAADRVPGVASAGLTRHVNGLEAFTPDGEFLLGPAAEVRGLWTACGFCAHGVSSAGGVGKVLAEWIVHGDPGLDLSAMDVRRFQGVGMEPRTIREGAYRIYSTYYDIPGEPGA